MRLGPSARVQAIAFSPAPSFPHASQSLGGGPWRQRFNSDPLVRLFPCASGAARSYAPGAQPVAPQRPIIMLNVLSPIRCRRVESRGCHYEAHLSWASSVGCIDRTYFPHSRF